MFYKGEVPFVRLLIPMILGIISGRFFAHPFLIKWGLELCLFILCIFLFLLLGYKRFSLFNQVWIFGLTIHAFLYILCFSLAVYESGRFDPLRFNILKADLLLVRVQNEPNVANGNFRFEGEVIGVFNKQSLKQSSGKINLNGSRFNRKVCA